MKKTNSYFFIGLALFSMFFGSGNLIFPLYIGQIAQENFLSATLGFLLTAVAFPFFGVLAMIVYKGDYSAFFSCLGKRTGTLLTALLLTAWVPLGSGPRCIVLAYASSTTYLNLPPLWVWSLFSCILIAVIAYKKSRMLDFLGYILTPLLLLCLCIIILQGLWDPSFSSSSYSNGELFFEGLKEGYNTMDLIAAFFFSASIIDLLRKTNTDNPIKLSLKSCSVGVLLLGIVYFFLIALSAAYSQSLEGIPKEQLLAQIAKIVLGSKMGIIAMVTIILACFTTLLALTSVYTDFLMNTLFYKHPKSKQLSLFTTLLSTFIFSTLGLKGITFITAPILQVFYPLLIVLIVINVGKKLLKTSSLSNSLVSPENT